ncbi:hypothetical protein [Acaryochloris sp. IP29b_bin.148]|uniref:hypothetical protein n=1 Tax=Acaryochloris sp. IP29b_bin.148 TaxID=2969218 RepID=UPI0026354BAD|nr:hypothetical protein [Acaryochloris sp. IP29b_bin.148]
MNRNLKHILLTAALSLNLLPMAVMAQEGRYVVVNGQRMTPQQLAVLDRVNCTRIQNGRYWYNPYTKLWGYEGNPYPQGRAGEACYQQQTPRQPSLSERGLLFSPGELLRD